MNIKSTFLHPVWRHQSWSRQKNLQKEIAFENNIPTGDAKWFDNYADACLYLENLRHHML